ncbi:MAG: DUF3147 family protein [Methylophilaceae bacterium]
MFLFKLFFTAIIIVIISEIAKHYDRLAALIASLPLVTLITLFWLYYENQPEEKIANHAYYTFWYVIPTLPMFVFFPWAIKVFGFWITFILSIFLTIIIFFLYATILKKFGINLI